MPEQDPTQALINQHLFDEQSSPVSAAPVRPDRCQAFQQLSESNRAVREQLHTSLQSNNCPACHGGKLSGTSFCSDCYYALPKPMRTALYNLMGRGYEEAFEAAMCQLKGIDAHA